MNDLHDVAESDTRRWLERAVIGLNLCPFAKAVHVKQQVRYVISPSGEHRAVLDLLAQELSGLAAADPAERDTTLLVVPEGFDEFLLFNDLVRDGERALRRLGLEGVLQMVSFHPQFQFDGTGADDITNFTNRSPHPTLHLLREASIARAVEAFPQAEAIYEANMETLERLGHEGWRALGVEASK